MDAATRGADAPIEVATAAARSARAAAGVVGVKEAAPAPDAPTVTADSVDSDGGEGGNSVRGTVTAARRPSQPGKLAGGAAAPRGAPLPDTVAGARGSAVTASWMWRRRRGRQRAVATRSASATDGRDAASRDASAVSVRSVDDKSAMTASPLPPPPLRPPSVLPELLSPAGAITAATAAVDKLPVGGGAPEIPAPAMHADAAVVTATQTASPPG